VDIVTIPPAEPLELTGERYTTAASGEIKQEHFHRYFFSLQFSSRKTVLDIASGEGYGSALLGIVAERVLGVDVAPEAVMHASRNYGSARVSFAVGDCAAMPLRDSSVEVAVSFETLEHVADQEKFFSEIKRVLRPDGMLVISTPNVEVYRHYGAAQNPFHIKELNEGEFREFLSRHFRNYRLFGQRSVIGSAIAPQPPHLGEADRQQTFRGVDGRVYSVQPGIGPPTYFIAVASDIALPEIHHGLLDDRAYLVNLHAELEQQLRVAGVIREKLEQQLRDRRTELVEMRNRAARVMGELQSREYELAQIRTLVDRIYGSMSWRLTRPLRFLWQMLDALKRRSVQLAGKLGIGRTPSRPVIFHESNQQVADEDRSPMGSLREPIAEPSPADWTESETELQMLERSGLFDEKFYCESNPDVALAEVSPLEHYFLFGALEGRRPNPLFDSAYYLITYPDVAKAGVNPALHYFLHGAREGRDPSVEFDTSFYLEANPEVASSGINPLVHYLRFGADQGRSPLKPVSK